MATLLLVDMDGHVYCSKKRTTPNTDSVFRLIIRQTEQIFVANLRWMMNTSTVRTIGTYCTFLSQYYVAISQY